jgi:hypothetical protein
MADGIIEKPRMVGRIKPKDLGNPKVPTGWDDDDLTSGRTHTLGRVIGKATGVKKVLTDPKDETSVAYALTGIFEGQPANVGLKAGDLKRRPVLQSGVLWLPGGLHEMFVAAVAGDDPENKRALKKIVPIDVTISTRKATNRAGYEYVNDVGDFGGRIVVADPLADLRDGAGATLLTDQSATPTADPVEAETEDAGERADAEDADTRRATRRRR